MVVVNEVGRKLGETTVPTTTLGHTAELKWVHSRFGTDVVWGVEDCRPMTARLECDLLAARERVIRVPPHLMSRSCASSRELGKSDPIDARACARAVLREPDLPVASHDVVSMELKMLVDRREDLVGQRVATVNRLLWRVHDLDPACDKPTNWKNKRPRETMAVWLADYSGLTADLARDELADINRLSDAITALETRIAERVRAVAPSLLALPGCAELTAAKIVSEVARVERFRSEAAFAGYVGLDPIPHWSGSVDVRVRPSRRGNRQLNVALHRIAVVQIRINSPGRRISRNEWPTETAVGARPEYRRTPFDSRSTRGYRSTKAPTALLTAMWIKCRDSIVITMTAGKRAKKPPLRPRRPTLQDVAEAAGVSVTSASRALHGATGPARLPGASTVKRVKEVAQRLGYSQDIMASGLRRRESRLLGVLVPRLSDHVLATIYEGIEEAAVAAGYQTLVANTHDDPDNQRARTQLMFDHRVDGLIFGDSHVHGNVFLDEASAQRVPFVLVNRRAGAHPSITADDVLGGRLAAQHLLDHGHTEFAVLAGESYASTGLDRCSGFIQRLREAGVEVPARRIITGSFDTRGGRIAMEAVLQESGPPPSAVFAVNDFAAIGAMGALRDAGLTVGKDVAVVGFNDVPPSAELPIPLSTVASPMNSMGRLAVTELLRLLQGHQAQSHSLSPRLMVRASSDFTP
jgi:DNA-binding LacI/PurR family transcriptional regulator/transposase